MFNCPIKAPVSENVKVANLFLVGFVRYFIWFLFALSHIRQREEQLESLPTKARMICIAIYSTGPCIVWCERANCVEPSYMYRWHLQAQTACIPVHGLVWVSECWTLCTERLCHGKIHSVLLNLCFKILFMNENRMGYRKTFGSRIWKRYFSHYLWLHLCIWNLSLCM